MRWIHPSRLGAFLVMAVPVGSWSFAGPTTGSKVGGIHDNAVQEGVTTTSMTTTTTRLVEVDTTRCLNRRDVCTGFLVSLLLVRQPEASYADVSDGTALPQGAAQFNRVVRLKFDLQGVRKRVVENSADIDKREWDNIGKFLRLAYSVGDDMKFVAAGIYDVDNKKRALEDTAQMRRYAQAGDVAVSKQDAKGFVVVVDKMIALVDDFFESLSDVPDEL